MRSKLTILYTSDVHGQLLATNYATNRKSAMGLSRLATYIKQIPTEILLLDNGDFLQGSPLLDVDRAHSKDGCEPIAIAMNHLGYHYLTLGNHDFNYGFDYLRKTLAKLEAPVVLANVLDSHGNPVFSPYVIHQTKSGLKIGIVGAITNYVPHWEKASHIRGLQFADAVKAVEATVLTLRPHVDYLIVLYHGGLERDLITHQPLGRPTDENQGYQISRIPGVDLLLTGHQHVPMVVPNTHGATVLQTGLMARDFGQIDLAYEGSKIIAVQASIRKVDGPEDETLVAKLQPFEQRTAAWLDQFAGTTSLDMTIADPLSCRSVKHPLFQFINNVQMELTKADLSCASLPNDCPGFSKRITRREIAANFIYPNTLYVLKINGKQLRAALERTAEYFEIVADCLTIARSFLIPKMEHYNYDVYDGIDYTIDPGKPHGERIVRLEQNGRTIRDDDVFTLVLNNYRAAGGGGYEMFQDCEVVAEYDVSLSALIASAIEATPNLDFPIRQNFQVNLSKASSNEPTRHV